MQISLSILNKKGKLYHIVFKITSKGVRLTKKGMCVYDPIHLFASRLVSLPHCCLLNLYVVDFKCERGPITQEVTQLVKFYEVR